jgi:uncharacterized protein (DUF58 family)
MSRLVPFLIVLIAVAFFTRVEFLFYLLYALFGILVLGRLWAQRSMRAVVLQRKHEERLFWGDQVPVLLEVRNSGWLPVLWLRLDDGVPIEIGSPAPHRWVISLAPHERQVLSYTLQGRRRGYYRLGPLVTLGGDLLGSTTYKRLHHNGDLVIVYPKIVPLRDLGFPSQSPFGTLPSQQRLFEDPTRIRGVRDFQAGDSLRQMDWKTTARVGSLQVRRYEPTMALETAVLLNLDSDDYLPQSCREATEQGIVVAASLATHLIEKRQAVSLVTNGRDPLHEPAPTAETGTASILPLRKGRAHLMQMLDLLARIERTAEDEAVPFLDLLNRRTLALPWGSTVVVITPREVEGLFDTLLTLRRRGLLPILVLLLPHREFTLTARRADQIGTQAIRIWSEQDLDVWR